MIFSFVDWLFILFVREGMSSVGCHLPSMFI